MWRKERDFSESTDPVSYTHLDVYKRQLENLFVGFVVLVVIVALKHGTKGITSYASIFIGIIVGYIVVSIMAVSYTHLDVYKRQVCVLLLRQLHQRSLTPLLEKSPEFVCPTESK